MKKNKGFTLIELMIVVAIIAIIAAIAIPNLLRSRLQSNESATIGNMKAIVSAQTSYNSANNIYADDFALLTGATPPFLDGAWDVTKAGYDYTITTADATNYGVTADPNAPGTSGNRYFFVDASGVIRFNETETAGEGDTPIGETAAAAP